MEDKSKVIFGNEIDRKTQKKAEQSKRKFIKRFGDDSICDYSVKLIKNKTLNDIMNVEEIRVNEGEGDIPFDLDSGLIVGNIRMGFGHYRISMAIASCAHALGYKPYWMDLNSFSNTTCTKVISAQNDLYSLGSRISQKSRLFNKTVWEPMNYEGFRKLSYNASDQKNAELMAPVFKNIPKDIPVVGTHVWPAQAAIHAGMKYVVNTIPDNWPMALHFAQGSVHTVQTHQAYMGYRILNGMQENRILNPIPADELVYTGHYIDHELVCNLESDCEKRIKRKKDKKPMRFLLTIGGAGAQGELFEMILRCLIPKVLKKEAVIYINVGDYGKVWDMLCTKINILKSLSKTYFDDFEKTKNFAQNAIDGDVEGIHAFCHSNIFEAVYTTNLLMRSTDVLMTKPSELAFYPVPKIFLKRIGGHEKWGAIHSAEMGDGTLECRDIPHTVQMISLFLNDETVFTDMCQNIINNNKASLYSGGYLAVKKAFELKNR